MTGIIEKEKTGVGVLNIISACCLCVWFTVPFFSYYPAIFFAFAAFWVVTAKGLSAYIIDNTGRFLLLAAFLAVALSYALYNPADTGFFGNLKVTLLGLFCVVFLDYYLSSGSLGALRIMCFISLTAYLSCSALSIFIFREDVVAIKRSLSTGLDIITSMNFGTFYSAVFVLAGCLFLLVRGRGAVRVLGVAGIVISALILYTGQFTLSIILAVVLLAMVLINVFFKPGLFWWSVILLAGGAACLMLITEMSSLLIWLSDHIPISYVSERMLDMAGYIENGQSFHSSARLDLYARDIECIIQNPVTGVLPLKAGGGVPELTPGGHSSLLGLIANYGIITSFLFCVFPVSVYRKVLRLYKGSRYYLFLCPICFIFVVLSVLNPTFNVQTLCFTMMVIIPSLPLLSPDFSDSNILV